MKIGVRILAAVVTLVVFVTGPFAPLAAAQQPPPSPTEPASQQPAPPPTEPAAQQPAPPPQQPAAQPTTTMPESLPTESRWADAAAYNVGAGIANVFYIPGKGILCGAGVLAGVTVMLFSVGSAPRTAAFFAREGCGGRWFLTGDDLRPEADVRFDWEPNGSTKY